MIHNVFDKFSRLIPTHLLHICPPPLSAFGSAAQKGGVAGKVGEKALYDLGL